MGGKEKGDNMKTKDQMSITELQTNELLNTEATAIEKKLKTAHNYYDVKNLLTCLLYTSPSPRDGLLSRMPSSA